jgi:hypothetical protein
VSQSEIFHLLAKAFVRTKYFEPLAFRDNERNIWVLRLQWKSCPAAAQHGPSKQIGKFYYPPCLDGRVQQAQGIQRTHLKPSRGNK